MALISQWVPFMKTSPEHVGLSCPGSSRGWPCKTPGTSGTSPAPGGHRGHHPASPLASSARAAAAPSTSCSLPAFHMYDSHLFMCLRISNFLIETYTFFTDMLGLNSYPLLPPKFLVSSFQLWSSFFKNHSHT